MRKPLSRTDVDLVWKKSLKLFQVETIVTLRSANFMPGQFKYGMRIQRVEIINTREGMKMLTMMG